MTEATSPTEAENPPAQRVSNGERPAQTLPSERISFANQLKILRGFGVKHGQVGRPVTNKDVSDVVGMSTYSVGLTNAFFVDVGFLARTGSGYVPAQEVSTFARAHQWNPATASQELAPLLAPTWFVDALIPKLQFQALSEKEALGVLGTAAKAAPRYEPNLRMLLDFMEASGLVMRDGDQVRSSGFTAPERSAEPSDPEAPAEAVAEPRAEAEVVVRRPTAASALHHPLIQGMIQELPAPGSNWTAKERDEWLELAKVALRVVYQISPSDKPFTGEEP